MKKLEMLFEEEANMILKCIYCGQLFSAGNREWMICPKAEIFIDFHGNVIAQHISDRGWDLNKFIHFLRTSSLSWREIYWKIYARTINFNCITCEGSFLGSQIRHCSFHPQKPKFSFGCNNGM